MRSQWGKQSLPRMARESRLGRLVDLRFAAVARTCRHQVTGSYRAVSRQVRIPAVTPARAFNSPRVHHPDAKQTVESDCQSSAELPAGTFLPFSHDLSLPHVPIFRIILSSRTRQTSLVGGKELDLPAENLELKLCIDF